MDLAAEVRNRDIALELLQQTGTNPDVRISSRLSAERKQAEQELAALLRRWGSREFSAKWRARLRL